MEKKGVIPESGARFMQPIGGKKAMALCILKILEDHSDVDHPLTQTEIIRRLADEYGVDAARNAVSRNISLLLEMGYDISTYEENGKGSFLRERIFDDMELRVLIDSVMTSRYIPAGDAARLVDKLGALSTRYFRARIPHVRRIDEWNHQRNRQFFYNLELLDEAIRCRRQVAFIYNRTEEDGALHPRRTTKDRVHPYALACTNGQYYLIGSHRSYDDLRHYRVDRITDLEPLDLPARDVREIDGCKNGLSVADYAQQHNFMYGGKAERVVMKMERSSAGDVLDAFGQAACMTGIDDDFMRVDVFGSIRGLRFFALQFGAVCEVLAPQTLRDTVRQDVAVMAEKYQV